MAVTQIKSGSRALGIAASDGPKRSYLCGVVVRADRVVDGAIFETCTVGGTDATAAVVRLVTQLARPDVRWILLSGIAPAWFNIIDIEHVSTVTKTPTISVSFEESDGLTAAIDREFDGIEKQQRLDQYRKLPDRVEETIAGDTLFLRFAGIEREAAIQVSRRFTPAGGRPEPIRVARMMARAHRQSHE